MSEPVIAKENDVTSILVPRVLEERIKARLPNSDFQNVNEYASYVLDQVLLELESREKKEIENGHKPETEYEEKVASGFSQKDQEDVEQRLRDLGYL